MKGAIRERPAHDKKWYSVPALQRDAARGACHGHAGQRAQPLDAVPNQPFYRRGAGVLAALKRHSQGQHVGRIEAGIHGAQRERCANEKGRAHQQDHRQGDFAHHQHGAGLVMAEARAAAPASFFQCGAEIGAGRSQRRDRAEEDARDHGGENRERQSKTTRAPSFPTRGRFAVFTLNNARIPTTPSADPTTAPTIDRRMLSVRS